MTIVKEIVDKTPNTNSIDYFNKVAQMKFVKSYKFTNFIKKKKLGSMKYF